MNEQDSQLHAAYTGVRQQAYTDDAKIKALQDQLGALGVTATPPEQAQPGQPHEDPNIVNARAQLEGSLNLFKSLGSGFAHGAQEVTNSAISSAKWFQDKGAELGLNANDYITDKSKVNFADQLVDPPTDPAGKLIAGVAQFAGPFALMGGAMGAVGDAAGISAEAGSALSKVKPLVQGALADFSAWDPHMERLSNLVQEHPWLSNPITQYLAADPKDTELEGRFKQALEGAGLGGLTDALFHGVKILKNVEWAKLLTKDAAQGGDAIGQTASDLMQGATKAPGTDLAPAPAGGGTKPPVDVSMPAKNDGQVQFKAIDAGTMDQKQVPMVPGAVDGGKALTKSADGVVPYKLNLSYVQAPEDVQSIMAKMSNAYKAEASTAARGVVSDKQLQELADASGLTLEKLKNRLPGEMLNPEGIKAARDLQVAAGQDLAEKLNAARGPQATPEAKAVFLDSFEKYRMIQAQVAGVKAEYGRGLRQMQLMATGTEAARARMIDQTINLAGGNAQVDDLIKMLGDRIDAQSGDIGKASVFAKVANRSLTRKLYDAVTEVYVNGKLSNPATHVVNSVTNAAGIPTRVAETALGAAYSALRNAPADDRIFFREATAQLHGAVDGLGDALAAICPLKKVNGKWTWDTSGFANFFPDGHDLKGEHFGQAISAENFGQTGTLGAGLDYLGAINRSFGNAMSKADEFSKLVHYRMTIRQEAVREALQKGLSGEAYTNFVNQAIQNPSEAAHFKAIDDARAFTWTKPLEGGFQAIDNAVAKIPLSRLLFPFRKTPLNMVEFAMERNPVLAPLLSNVREDLAIGGARRDAALGKISLGMGIMSTGAALAYNGMITGRGPKDPATRKMLEATGWRPYSIKIGDTYYAYNRMEPLGSVLGMAADYSDIAGDLAGDRPEDATQLAIASGALAVHNMLPEHLVQGFSAIIKLVNDGDASALKSIPQDLANFGGAFQGLRTFLTRLGDNQVNRDTKGTTPWDEIYNKIRNTIPGKSDELPPRLNLWGDPVHYDPGIGPDITSPLFSGFATSKASEDPVDKEILRLSLASKYFDPQMRQGESDIRLSMPPRELKMTRGKISTAIPLEPKEYYDYVRLASGHGLNGAPLLKDALREKIKNFTPSQNDQQRRAEILKIVRIYQENAKKALVNKYPAILEKFQTALKEGVGVWTEPGGQTQ